MKRTESKSPIGGKLTLRHTLMMVALSFLLTACNDKKREEVAAPVSPEVKEEVEVETKTEAEAEIKTLVKISVYDLSNQLLSEITDASQLLLTHENWKQRKEVVFIQRPEFKYRLDLHYQNADASETGIEQWLYDGMGTITQFNKAASLFYQITDDKLKASVDPAPLM